MTRTLSRPLVLGLAALVLLTGCESEQAAAPAAASPAASPAASCPTLPTSLDNGLLGDAPGSPDVLAGEHDRTRVVLGGDPVRVDLLAGASVPPGTTARAASVSGSDLGGVAVCDGGTLVFTPGGADALQGTTTVRYCLEQASPAGCGSVTLDVVAPSTAAVLDAAARAGAPEPALILTGDQQREVMRSKGMTTDGLLRLQSLNDTVFAEAATFGEDFPARLLAASQCGGLTGTLTEEYSIMLDSLAFTVKGFGVFDAELAAMTSGTAPDVPLDAGEKAKQQVTDVFTFHDVVTASLDGAGTAGAARGGLAKAGIERLPNGKVLADPKGEFCMWALTTGVGLLQG